MTNREFEHWLRRASREQKMNALLRGQRIIMNAQKLDFEMELQQMADFNALNARVSKLTSVTESIKTMNDGLKAERDALKAELDTLKAADAVDQDAVDAAEASLATVNATLDALAAVATGTPDAPSLGGT